MSKSYYSLGLMSGTSMDGVDASVIQTDGKSKYKAILDKYFEYPQAIYKQLTKLRDKIKSSKNLRKFSKEIKNVEKKITLFHAKSVNQILKTFSIFLIFFSICFSERIFLVSSFPEGSPILVGPPPNKTIG